MVPHYVSYTLSPQVLQKLNALAPSYNCESQTSEKGLLPDHDVIQYNIVGQTPTSLDPAVRQLVAAALPGQTPGAFRVTKRALKLPFDVLHPRGADGRFISKGGDVKWRNSTTGLWQRGTVTGINTNGTIDITETNGLKTTRSADTLFATSKPIAKLSPSNFTMLQSGGSRGSFFSDPATGEVWYVKTPSSTDHVANEIAANRLYGMAGVAVPEVKISTDGKKILSKVEDSEGWYELDPAEKDAAREDIRKNFLIDAWLANYDAPRSDNIRVTSDGLPIRVDTGAALNYRASGAPKAKLPADMTAEIAKLGQQSAYRGLTPQDEEDSVKRILGIAPDDIRAAIREAGLTSGTADDLIDRREWLAQHYGYVLPENTPAGKAALAARAVANNGGNSGSNSVGSSSSSSNTSNPVLHPSSVAPAVPVTPATPIATPKSAPVSSVPAAPAVSKPTTFAQAVRKRDSTQAAPLTPGSPVWLRKKPTLPTGSAKYPDTWTVASVSADGQTVGIITANGKQQISVPVSSVEVLRTNKSSVKSIYATGEQPSLLDRVAFDLAAGVDPKTHPGDGVITELYPMYAKVLMDNGSPKVVHVKKLSLVPDKGTSVAQSGQTATPSVTTAPKSTTKTGLYSDPFDNNAHQNDYIKQAETLIRAGDFVLRQFSTAELIPTQPESQTQGTGSGRGAKDLGPIVARINNKLYLLDGHHRAYNSAKIKAQFVDLDAAGITGTTANPSANPKGVPFDFATYDFVKSPNPIGYSLTHKSPVAYVGKAYEKDGTPSDRDIIAILPNKANPKDPIPVRIRADNFRVLTSVDHDALMNPPVVAPVASAKKHPKDFDTLAEAKTKLKPMPISVKYPASDVNKHPDLYQLQAGDRVLEIRKRQPYDNGVGGIYLFRDGNVHYLGASLKSDFNSYEFISQDASDTSRGAATFGATISETYIDKITDFTVKYGKRDGERFVKAARLAAADRQGDLLDYKNQYLKKMKVADPAQTDSLRTKYIEVDWPSWLSPNVTSLTLNTRGASQHTNPDGSTSKWQPSFVYDKDNDKMYYIGDTDMAAAVYGKEKFLKGPDEWTELTQAQRDFYFDFTQANNGNAGQGSKATSAAEDDIELKSAIRQDSLTNVPPVARIFNHKGELLSRDLSNNYSRYTKGYVGAIHDAQEANRIFLQMEREDGRIGRSTITRDALRNIPMTPEEAEEFKNANSLDSDPTKLDPNAKPPKPGDILPNHRNPYVESKLTPIQALNYELPTSQTRLDQGEQDDDLLAARLVSPEEAQTIRSGGGAFKRPTFKAHSDDTSHKDLLLYEYTKNIGGDAGVIRLSKADFDAYVKANDTIVLYRGVGSAGSTFDLRSGTHFAGEGVYGSGAYASNKLNTAQHSYANSNLSHVTRFTPRKGTKSIDYSDAFYEMLESVDKGASERVDYLASLGLSPSMNRIKNANSQDFSALPSNYARKINTADTAMRDRAALMIDFYTKKGFTLLDVESNAGYYSLASDITISFTKPGRTGETFFVRITNPRSGKIPNDPNRTKRHWDPVVDFRGTDDALRHTNADLSVSRTSTSGEAFSSGFASPKEMMSFLSAVDPKFHDDTLFVSSPKKAKVKTEDEANELIENTRLNHPELARILGQTARLEFIQDVGRFALAAGYDWFVIDQFGGEKYIVMTNRNAMLMSR